MSPLDMIKADVLQCSWDTPVFMFFSSEITTGLVYYSHLFPAIGAIIFFLILIFSKEKSIQKILLVIISILFILFSLCDLYLWASPDPSKIMFFWSLLTYIEPLIYALTLYLVLSFARKGDISFLSKVTGVILLLPIILFGSTSLNILAFDYSNCDRLAVEGPLLIYVYFIEVIFVLWILISAIYYVRNTKDSDHKRSLKYLTVGSLLFLFSFSFGNIFGTFFQNILGEDAWVLGQYGFFGMPIFLGFITYMIVKFQAFKTKLLPSQALVLTLCILIGSLLFIAQSTPTRIIASFTLFFIIIFGIYLIKSVKAEIKQREEIERLASRLEQANTRLKQLDKQKSEFVSIASHQLRSPLTSIAGYASMLREGNYGVVPSKMVEPLDRIEHSARFMAESIEDYLNVSRIESGNMKYHLSDFSLRNETELICDDIRAEALRKGLVLLFRTSLTGKGVVNADLGKVQQILHNLINNSLKYTPKGTLNVVVRDNPKAKKVYVDIVDTGIGMDHETLDSIFQKFERGNKANTVNVKGTGLGLYVALKMAEAMGGTITAHSEGEGKGSRFTLELPFVM